MQKRIRKVIDDILLTTVIDIKFSCNPLIESADDKIKHAIFRIVQEHMKNVLSYSKATKVEIDLEILSDSSISLVILDNGVGFDPLAVRRGMGLSNISDRATAYGGFASIQSSVGKGCTLFVSIPFMGHLAQGDDVPGKWGA